MESAGPKEKHTFNPSVVTPPKGFVGVAGKAPVPTAPTATKMKTEPKAVARETPEQIIQQVESRLPANNPEAQASKENAKHKKEKAEHAAKVEEKAKADVQREKAAQQKKDADSHKKTSVNAKKDADAGNANVKFHTDKTFFPGKGTEIYDMDKQTGNKGVFSEAPEAMANKQKRAAEASKKKALQKVDTDGGSIEVIKDPRQKWAAQRDAAEVKFEKNAEKKLKAQQAHPARQSPIVQAKVAQETPQEIERTVEKKVQKAEDQGHMPDARIDLQREAKIEAKSGTYSTEIGINYDDGPSSEKPK